MSLHGDNQRNYVTCVTIPVTREDVIECGGYTRGVATGKGQWGWITPTPEWQTMTLSDIEPEDFAIEVNRFFVDVKLNYAYLDPAAPETRRR